MLEFYSWSTGNGIRAQIALEESGLEYTVRPVNLWAHEHKKPEFLKLNPLGRIPVLVETDDAGGPPSIVTQSMAIMHIAAARSGLLLSDDPDVRIKELEWLALVMTDFVAPVNFGALLRMRHEEHSAGAVLKHRGYQVLPVMDGRLSGNAFLGGSAFSLADCAAIPMANFIGEEALEDYPYIRRWLADVGDRPSVKATLTSDFDTMAKKER